MYQKLRFDHSKWNVIFFIQTLFRMCSSYVQDKYFLCYNLEMNCFIRFKISSYTYTKMQNNNFTSATNHLIFSYCPEKVNYCAARTKIYG